MGSHFGVDPQKLVKKRKLVSKKKGYINSLNLTVLRTWNQHAHFNSQRRNIFMAQFRPQVFHPVVIQMGLLCLLSSCNNTHISSGWVNGVALGSSGGLGRGQYAGLGHMHLNKQPSAGNDVVSTRTAPPASPHRHHPMTPPQTAACSLARPDYNLARPVHDKITSCKAKTTKTRLTYPFLCDVYRCSNQTAT